MALGEPWFAAIRDEASRRSLGPLGRELQIEDGGTGEDATLLGASALLLDPRARPDGASMTDGVRAIAPPRPVAGIDIGGTKIAVLVVDADGAVLGRATRSSSAGDQDGAAEAIVACLDEALVGAAWRATTSTRSASGCPAGSTRAPAR